MIRISEREVDLCCVAVVKRTWTVHDYTITDITDPGVSLSYYCVSGDITCDGSRSHMTSYLFTITRSGSVGNFKSKWTAKK